MKLSTISVTNSQMRHFAESILDAPVPRQGQHTLSYHIVYSAIELGTLSEGLLGNMMAQMRASSRPIPNVDNLLWITAPNINASTKQVIELAKKAGNLPGSIMDKDQEAQEWWNTLFKLFSATDTDKQRVLSQIKIEAKPTSAAQPDENAELPPSTNPNNNSGGGGLDAETKKMLADIVRQHKDTGDAISALIKDMKADMARKNPKGAMKHAQEILQQDQVEKQQKPRQRRASAAPGPKKKPKDGPVTKHTPEPPPPSLWGEDYLLELSMLQERFTTNSSSILEHTFQRLIGGGVPVYATDASKRLYWNMVENVVPRTGLLFREEGFGNKLWSGMKGAASGLMDRWQNPVGSASRDDFKRKRIENVLLAKSAIALLAQITADRFKRLPREQGADLMRGEHTEALRDTARQALGIRDAAIDPDQFGTYSATT